MINVNSDIIFINGTLSDHNTWLTILENATPPPQALSQLTDVDFTIAPVLNQVLKYNGTDWYSADESGGIQDAPIDSASYVWEDGQWVLLATTSTISQISSDIGTINGNITSLTTQVGNIQTDVTALQGDVLAL